MFATVPNAFEMRQRRKEALDKAEAALGARDHVMTPAETENYNAAMTEVKALNVSIEAREKLSTIRGMLRNGALIVEGATPGLCQPISVQPDSRALATPEYTAALHQFLVSGGKAHTGELSAGADGHGGFYVPGSEKYTRQRGPNGMYTPPTVHGDLYEGTGGSSDTAGGYAISVPTVQQVVPLGMPDLGIFDASTVIPTATDIKIPVQASFGTSAVKVESTGTLATFGGTDPTLGQFTLSAYMIGALRWASWELLQDVETFQQFLVDDLLKGQRILEGSLLANGTGGTSQPQGVFGNTGTGTGSAYSLAGTSADATTLLDSLFDVTAQLKGVYQPNAVWVMSRATGLAIRRAQMQTNLFAPVATVDPDGTERILGRPVFYDQNAPNLPSTTTTGTPSILFGDFKAGYIIGVRGGAGINVKILDQPQASAGLLGLLAYRRIDGRVRRSEAIQAISFSHA